MVYELAEEVTITVTSPYMKIIGSRMLTKLPSDLPFVTVLHIITYTVIYSSFNNGLETLYLFCTNSLPSILVLALLRLDPTRTYKPHGKHSFHPWPRTERVLFSKRYNERGSPSRTECNEWGSGGNFINMRLPISFIYGLISIQNSDISASSISVSILDAPVS